MKIRGKWSTLGAASLLLGVLLLVGACKKEEPVIDTDDGMLGGQIGILNYTDIPIGVVFVNGQWAGSMVANAGGTKWIGGISVPKHWDPDFKVEISWSDDILYEMDKDALYTKEVSIEKYPTDDASFFYVAFFPNHEVKLYLTKWGPGAKDDPYQLPDPKVACIKRRGENNKNKCYAPDHKY